MKRQHLPGKEDGFLPKPPLAAPKRLWYNDTSIGKGSDATVKRRLRLLALMLLWTLLAPCAHALAFEPLPYEMAPAPYAPHQECFLPEDAGYHDDSLDIRIETFREYDTTIMAVYVTLTDPSQLRTGSASPNQPKSQLTSTTDRMAKHYQAVLAINGDYFSFHREGVVVRNGVTLREQYNINRDTLIIDENGDFTIITPTTEEAYQAFDGTVIHAFCFGPGLVVDGEQLTNVDGIVLDLGKNRQTQRIAIGQLGPLSYVILATEGPENTGSVGLTLLEMAELCKQMGCINAYNLDGGSSSSVALNYRKINALSSRKNRPVGDIIYFCTLVP